MAHISYSLNSLSMVLSESIIRVIIQGDTRSLDYGSHETAARIPETRRL